MYRLKGQGSGVSTMGHKVPKLGGGTRSQKYWSLVVLVGTILGSVVDGNATACRG